MGKDIDNSETTWATVATRDTPNRTVDNLILHDSTGNNLDIEKLFPHDSSNSIKKWAPYVDIAQGISQKITAKKSVVLITGVRHLTQIMNKTLSFIDFEEKISCFIDTTKKNSPGAQIIISSILPSNNDDVKSVASEMNQIISSLAHKKSICYADSAARFRNTVATMQGIHPKVKHIGLLASPIIAAIRQSNSVSGVRPRMTHAHPPRFSKASVNRKATSYDNTTNHKYRSWSDVVSGSKSINKSHVSNPGTNYRSASLTERPAPIHSSNHLAANYAHLNNFGPGQQQAVPNHQMPAQNSDVQRVSNASPQQNFSHGVYSWCPAYPTNTTPMYPIVPPSYPWSRMNYNNADIFYALICHFIQIIKNKKIIII
jgi:hypothetical protein